MAGTSPENQSNNKRPRGDGKREKSQLGVKIRYVSVPDAEARISRAIDILLGAVTGNTDLLETKGDTLPNSPGETRLTNGEKG